MPRLIVSDGKTERTIDLGDQPLVLGRAPDCSVVLDDKESSRHHAQIEKADAGYKVVDLESRNGTRVNGKGVNVHLLRHGDRVEIGKSLITFEGDDAHDRADIGPETHRAKGEGSGPETAPHRAAGPGAGPEPAAPPARPPHRLRPSAEPRTVLRPRGDDSETRHRVLLHRTIIGSVVVGSIFVLLIIYSLVSTKDPDEVRAERLWNEAIQLEQHKSYRDALKKIRDIGQHLSTAPEPAPEQTSDRTQFEQLVKFADANPDEVHGFIEKIGEFRNQHPASPLNADLERKAAEMKQAKLARDEQLLQKTMADVNPDKPISALRKLNAFTKANPALSAEVRMKLEVRLTSLRAGGREFLDRMKRQAVAESASGKTDDARRSYQSILEECGDDPEYRHEREEAEQKIREIASPEKPKG